MREQLPVISSRHRRRAALLSDVLQQESAVVQADSNYQKARAVALGGKGGVRFTGKSGLAEFIARTFLQHIPPVYPGPLGGAQIHRRTVVGHGQTGAPHR